MEKYNSVNIPLPHNLPGGEMSVKRIRKLVNTALELGGNVYDVAKDSGLLSAHHFLEENFGSSLVQETDVSEDITLLTEAYVYYPKSSAKERIFLYSEDAAQDDRLKDEGSIQNGQLIIEYNSLKDIHANGYRCLYMSEGNEKKGMPVDRFRRIFKQKQKRISFKTWDPSCAFLGNGINRALRVRTHFETVIVMPDIYAVQESIKTFHAENLIREQYDADFSIERISPGMDVSADLENTFGLLFGSDRQTEYETLPDSYRRLVCQVAYIRFCYPDVYEAVWERDYKPDDETVKTVLDEDDEVSLGISFADKNRKSYAVCRMSDGTVKRVPSMGCSFDEPLCRKYEFKGYGYTLRNPGVNGSRMAIQMNNMVQSAEVLMEVTVTSVYVTHVGKLPTSKELASGMSRWQKKMKKYGNPDMRADLIAYNEVADKNLDGLGTIMWAAELAKIPNIEYVEPVTAIVNAYEKQAEENRLKDKEIALIYDFSEDETEITLVRKHEDGELEIINRKNTNESERQTDEEDGSGNGFMELRGRLEEALENFMLDEGLRAVGIDAEQEQEAFRKLRESVPRVKRQFKRNDTAKLFFDGSNLHSVVKDYPIKLFEECYKPVLKNNEELMRETLKEAELSMNDVAKVYLAGSECGYPFVRKKLEKIANGKVRSINAAECVAARGAALSGGN